MARHKKGVTRQQRKIKPTLEKKGPSLTTKPRKYKVGDKVLVDFIGSKYKSTIILLEERFDPHRWVYKVKTDELGWVIPCVGIGKSEQFANIVEAKK